MKKLLAIFAAGLLFTACNQTNQSEKAGVDVAAVKTIELHVTGMTCEGCENTVMKAVNQLEGVTGSTASHVKELTVVSYDTTLTNTEAITAAIEKVGYTVEGPAMKQEPVE
ncbi:cation transporter [Lentimicrobium sp.]|jgi:copper chaperone CopZ|uniref:cation transporter n=1 Tax=Lentimicrobium sp. TaxID=2034841 RepID=UPI002D127FFE|nr:cation transporter [Lentimicrobium sp.]HPJ61205.1 cation transporter [Lentimicrobium sp.]